MRSVSTSLIGLAALIAACSNNPAPATTAPQAAPAPTAAQPAPATTTTTTTTTTAATTPAPAPAAAVDMSGGWVATLDVQGQTLAVEISLTRTAAGYTGEAVPPGQAGAPLSSLTLAADHLTLTFTAPDGDAVFAGTLSADHRAVAGTLSYQGQSIPFNMTKKP